MLVLGETLPEPYDQTRTGEREVLREAGAELVVVSTLDEFRELAPEADGVLNWSFSLGADELARLTHCRCIAHHAVGVDHIDTAEAARLGIVVANVPRYGTDDVADQAMMLLLASARKLHAQERIAATDRWTLSPLVPIYRLRGRTLGILGLGNIGSAVAKRAAGFGLDVVAHDPYVDADRFTLVGAESVSFDELLRRSDILTLHTPLTPETRGMIDAGALARLRPGAILINVARGPIVDETAVADALMSGHLAAAAIDVFGVEPLPLDAPIRRAPRTILTPHTAFYSESSVEAMQVDAAREVAAALRGDAPPHLVILPGIDWNRGCQRWNLRPSAEPVTQGGIRIPPPA